MNRQIVLEDEILMLRPLQASDRDALFAIASDPKIWDQHHARRFEPEVFDLFFKESLDSGGAYLIIDKNSNRAIGSSRYQIIPVVDAVEIGWTFFDRSHWGKGTNRRVKKLMVNHALTGKSEVIFYVWIHNYRSQKAMTKLGAHLSSDPAKAHDSKPEITLTYLIDQPL